MRSDDICHDKLLFINSNADEIVAHLFHIARCGKYEERDKSHDFPPWVIEYADNVRWVLMIN